MKNRGASTTCCINLVYGIEWTPLGALHSILEHEAKHKLHIARLLAAYEVYLQPHGDGGFILLPLTGTQNYAN